MKRIIYHNQYSTTIKLENGLWYLLNFMHRPEYKYIINSENQYHMYYIQATLKWYKTSKEFNIYPGTNIVKIYNNFSEILTDYPELIDL